MDFQVSLVSTRQRALIRSGVVRRFDILPSNEGEAVSNFCPCCLARSKAPVGHELFFRPIREVRKADILQEFCQTFVVLADPVRGGAKRAIWVENNVRVSLDAHCFSFAHLSQLILISFSSGLNSGSPVTSSAFFSFASAAAKASARLILKRALKSAARSARRRSTGWNSSGRLFKTSSARSQASAPSFFRSVYFT